MYALLIVIGFGAFAYYNMQIRDDEFANVSRKMGDRLGKLWDIAHQACAKTDFYVLKKPF